MLDNKFRKKLCLRDNLSIVTMTKAIRHYLSNSNSMLKNLSTLNVCKILKFRHTSY